jgi:protein SCO1/2
LIAIVLLTLLAGPTQARLTASALGDAGVAPPQSAHIPRETLWRDMHGGSVDLTRVLGDRPSLLLFADFTCSTLCGPILTLVTSALADVPLKPGADYHLIVLGLDPKDGASEAASMKRKQITVPAIAKATTFLSADQATVLRVANAVGYRYSYDAEHDQFAHPAAALVLAADGRLVRVLSGLGLTSTDLHLALIEAGEGRVGNFGDRVRLLCYGFDAASGTYTASVHRALMISSAIGAMALIGLIAGLSWRSSRS